MYFVTLGTLYHERIHGTVIIWDFNLKSGSLKLVFGYLWHTVSPKDLKTLDGIVLIRDFRLKIQDFKLKVRILRKGIWLQTEQNEIHFVLYHGIQCCRRSMLQPLRTFGVADV